VASLLRALPRGAEARLDPLLLDLTLFAPPDWSLVDRKPGDDTLPVVELPAGLLAFFAERGYAPPMPVLAAWLADCERRSDESLNAKQPLESILAILAMMRKYETREAMQATARWAVRVTALQDASSREYILRGLLLALVVAPPAPQVDLGPLKREVLGALPYDQVAGIEKVFDDIESDMASLRAPSGESLVRWMQGDKPDKRFIGLLDRGADPNAPDRMGNPPLLAAARKGLPWVAVLVERGAIVRATGREGESALHMACRAGSEPERPEVASFLLQRGADVNASTRAGSTPLHYAGASPRCAALLLASGAKLEAEDGTGRTPLHATVQAGNLEAVKLLLAAGANPNREAKGGITPYGDATMRPRADITAALKQAGGRLSAREQAERAKAELMRVVPPVSH
jgi:hypothetical protein